MINWTDEAVRAEADYRREALHRMVGTRKSTSRSALWQRLIARRRH